MDICQLWQNPEYEQQVQRTDHTGFTCQPVSAKSEISSQSLQADVVHQSPKVETESANQNSDAVVDVPKVSHENHHHSFPQPDKLNHRSVSPAPSLQCQVTHHVGSLSESEVAAVSQEPAQEEAADTVVKIRMMPLDVLSKEKIAFGKAKNGQLFPEVFKDAAWTDWFIRTYEKSTKPEHQLYVQYVTKRLDMEIKAEHTKGYHKESRAFLADQKCQAPADSEVWISCQNRESSQTSTCRGSTRSNRWKSKWPT